FCTGMSNWSPNPYSFPLLLPTFRKSAVVADSCKEQACDDVPSGKGQAEEVARRAVACGRTRRIEVAQEIACIQRDFHCRGTAINRSRPVFQFNAGMIDGKRQPEGHQECADQDK